MITDLNILAILSDRKQYEKFYPHVEQNFLTNEGDIIGKSINQFFKEDKLKSTDVLDWSKFGVWFFLKNPMLSLDQKNNMKRIFESLDIYEDDDEDFTNQVLEELTIKSYATSISNKALAIASGSDTDRLDSIQDMVQECTASIRDMTSDEDPYLAPTDFEFLFGEDDDHPTLEFSLQELRDSCGGITIGNFVVVGAHPDTGKTTFLLGEASHMLSQVAPEQVILYFNNEQSKKDMKHRLLSSILGTPNADIWADPVKSLAEFEARGGDRIKMYDKHFMDVKFVEDRIRRHEGLIGLIVFDQLWKIHGISRSSNDFMQLGHQFAWARGICKQHAPVIAVHQCDSSTYNTKYIEMSGLFGSKVAVQGEADAIITIGRMTDGSTLPNLRHFYVPKNKLKGLDPTARNAKFDAFIDHELVKFTSV